MSHLKASTVYSQQSLQNIDFPPISQVSLNANYFSRLSANRSTPTTQCKVAHRDHPHPLDDLAQEVHHFQSLYQQCSQENELLRMDLLRLGEDHKQRENMMSLQNAELQSQLQEVHFHLQESQKCDQSRELIEQIKQLESTLQEKECQLKKMKKELDQSQKKLTYQNQDHSYQLSKLKSEIEDSLNDEIEELKGVNEEQKKQISQLTDECRKANEVLKLCKEENMQLLGYKNKNEKLIAELEQSVQNLDKQIYENERQNHLQNQLVQQSHIQEVNRLKHQLSLQNENYQQDLESLQRNSEIDKQVLVDLCGQRENDKNELNLLLNEMEVQQAQIEELKRQNALESQIHEQWVKEEEGRIRSKYEAEIEKVLRELSELQKHYERKEYQCQSLQVEARELDLKASDLAQMNGFLSQENEQLKKTLMNLQNQRQQDESLKEEAKRRDMMQMQQYHEAIQEQLSHEISGMSTLLSQKAQECEQWRSSYLRKML